MGSLGRGSQLGLLGSGREILAVVGDRFVYARGRAPFPAGVSSRAALVWRADCEFSYGRVTGWAVELSTIPWNEGSRLGFVERVTVVGDGLRVEGGDWQCPVNTLTADELRTWFR